MLAVEITNYYNEGRMCYNEGRVDCPYSHLNGTVVSMENWFR